MQTDSWGPSAWETLHYAAFGSPEILDKDDKINYKNFYTGMRCILPCSLCRSAFKQLLHYIDIDSYIDSRDGLCYWTFVLHNLVNRKLDKSLETFDNVIYKYENRRARCGNKNNSGYSKCISELTEFSKDDAKIKAKAICKKYDIISHKQIENYYKSKWILDPKYEKCSV